MLCIFLEPPRKNSEVLKLKKTYKKTHYKEAHRIPGIIRPLWKKIIFGSLVSIPLIISIGTIISVLNSNTAPIITTTGILFSPVKDSKALVTGLAIFTIGYLVFIGFLFSHNIRELFIHKTRQ